MSARLPLGILLTAAPILMLPAVSVVGTLLEDAPGAQSAATIPLAVLVLLVVSAVGVLLVRAGRRPLLRKPLGFTTACLAVVALGLVVFCVGAFALPFSPIEPADEIFPFLGVTVTGMWMAFLGGLGAAAGALVMAVVALGRTRAGHTSRA